MSNISDEQYVGIERTLALFAPLLRPAASNPHATLLTLFLTMKCESNIAVVRQATMEAMQYFPEPTPTTLDYEYAPHAMMIMAARKYFRNFDKDFAEHAKLCGFDGAAKAAGARMKRKHTVVDAWPCGWTRRAQDRKAREELELLVGTDHSAFERYVEWKRA